MLMRNLRGIYTIWYRDVLRFVRDRPRILVALAQPLLYLFVFGTGLAPAMAAATSGAVDYRQFMFPGILALAVLFTAIFSAISVGWDREFGFLKEVMVAPVARTAVALGKVAGGATIAMMQGLIVLLLAPFIGVRLDVATVLEIVGVMLLLACVATAFGIMISARQKSMEGFQMIMNFLLLPMFFLSGAFFPLRGVPRWLAWLARIDPVTYGVDALRGAALRNSVAPDILAELTLYPVLTDVMVMAGLAVVFLIPAVWLFAKQD
jgi:ABC-2 type transport system permease protein